MARQCPRLHSPIHDEPRLTGLGHQFSGSRRRQRPERSDQSLLRLTEVFPVEPVVAKAFIGPGPWVGRRESTCSTTGKHSLATKSAQRCSIRKMRTKTIVCVATLVCAAVAAGIWLGYHQGGTSTVSPPLEGSSPPMTNDPSREYKTVKKEFSQDSATSVEQMKPATAVLLVGYGNKSAEIQPLQPPALALPIRRYPSAASR